MGQHLIEMVINICEQFDCGAVQKLELARATREISIITQRGLAALLLSAEARPAVCVSPRLSPGPACG